MADIERVLGFAMHARTLFASITILLLLIAAPLAIVEADEQVDGLDTAQRDDVVEEESGASEVVDQDTEGLLPGVDTAVRGDVVYEGEGATGSAGNAPAPAGRKVTLHIEDSVGMGYLAQTATRSSTGGAALSTGSEPATPTQARPIW